MRRLVAVGWLALVMACTGPGLPIVTQGPPEATAVFTIPTSDIGRPFGDVPFPTDVDTRPGGLRNVESFPNPVNGDMIEVYREVAAKKAGWGLNGAVYLRFTAPIDVATLPADHAATLVAGAAVQLVDVDAASPEKGTRIPLRLRFVETPVDLFTPANTLIALPVLGFPLRPGTHYALVVTDTVKGKSGGRVAPSDDLKALLASGAPSDSRLTAGHTAFAPLRDAASTLGLDLTKIVQATVFTTHDPLPQLDRARARMLENAPYAVNNLVQAPDHNSHGAYWVYEGTIALPQFQKGVPPFDSYDGQSGGFVPDSNDIPQPQRSEDVRFTLTIPKAGSMPAAGWPIVVIATGTGGDYRTGIGDRFGDEAFWAAGAGCGTVTIGQPLHYTRQGYREGAVELLTFNFLNPPAGIDNWRQSALESMAVLHSLQNFNVPAAIGPNGAAATINPVPKLFFGHSQGGITGSLMSGIETDLDVAALSGTGGGFAESLLEKTEPINIANAVKLVLSLPSDEPLDEFHPVLTFLQMIADPLEPLNAARRYFRDGRKAPNILFTSGLMDMHTPPRTHGPLSAAAHIPLLVPKYSEVEAMTLRDILPVDGPATDNMSLSNNRQATAVVAQFPNNDHFAVYENPSAAGLVSNFFKSFLANGHATAQR